MNNFLKRFFDIFVSLFFLILLAPIFLIIAIAIKLDSRGGVIFIQKRIKKDGELFNMYKFRSMIQGAEKEGTGLFNYKNDYRVTRVGRILRNTSLDELPQLVNVLKGDMSLVGPRPPVSYELGNFNELNFDYKRRFTVRPGITGLAQVTGRNELEWDEKVIQDNRYIDLFQKYGILIDIQIIFRTLLNVFKVKDIYEVEDELMKGLSDEEKRIKSMKKVISKAKDVQRIEK